MDRPGRAPDAGPSSLDAELSGPFGKRGVQRDTALALIVILASVFLAYFRTLSFQFVLDDRYQIVDNTWLRSWRYLPRYFTSDVWAFLHPTFPGNLYRPLFLVLFRLQYMVVGLNPWGWHLCTVLAHVAVTLLVYYLARQLLKDRLAGLFAALIFGLHPVHADAVAWVSGVTEPLLALFLIPSFLCYLRKRSGQFHARANLVASLVLYVLAMLAKETALVLPMIIFGSELIWSARTAATAQPSLPRRCLQALFATAPYLVASAAYLILRAKALHGFQNPREWHSFLSMVLTWPSVLCFYLRHMLWPVGMSPFYDMTFVAHPSVTNFLLPTVVILVVLAGLWMGAKRFREFALASFWLTLPILPVLNLRVFTEGHFVHDRYLYLPSVGLAMLAALGGRQLCAGRVRLFRRPAVQTGMVVVFAVVLGVGVTRETACYADENAYYNHLALTSGGGPASKLNLANLQGEKGNFEAAIVLYQEILREKPDNWEVNYDLGYAYYLQGQIADADRYLARAVSLDPGRPESYFYLGLAKLKEGDVAAASDNVRHAIYIRPDAEHYHFALGVILKLQGDLPGALSEFRAELEIDPNSAAARQQAAEIEAAHIGKPMVPGSAPAPREAAP